MFNTHSPMDSMIPPDGMDTILQLHRSCSISHKGLHQVQLLHRASFESPWVMKNKVRITPKNQFIFNVMAPPLNAVSTVHAAGQAFNSPPMNPVQSQGQSANFYTSIIWSIAYQKVLDSFALGIEYLGELCGITNTLQHRRFACVRSADNEDPEPTYTIEVLLDLRRIHAEIPFNTWGDDRDLRRIYMMRIFSACRDSGTSCGTYMIRLFSQRDGWGLRGIYAAVYFSSP